MSTLAQKSLIEKRSQSILSRNSFSALHEAKFLDVMQEHVSANIFNPAHFVSTQFLASMCEKHQH